MGKKWTVAEEDFLIENQHKGYAYCAKKLNRSTKAVWVKADVLGLGGCVKGSEYLTGQNVINITGISKRDVWSWLKLGLIKHKIAPIKQKCYLVKISDLEDFLKNNQDLWDSRKLKASFWRNKPDWLKEKIKNDRLLPSRRPRKCDWTELEIQKLITMRVVYKRTYKEIGAILGKSENAIRCKSKRLRERGRLCISEFQGG